MRTLRPSDNQRILEIEKKIKEEFANRPNSGPFGKIDFDNDRNKPVLREIAKTYAYYQTYYPDKLDKSKTLGLGRITKVLGKVEPDNLADLYLDRLLLNCIELRYDDKGSKGEFAPNNLSVSFNLNSCNSQSNYWEKSKGFFLDKRYESIVENNKKLLKANLNAKVIAHEFSHCSTSANFGDKVGFHCGTKETYCSRLEEIMAEKTALDVTGQKISVQEQFVSGDTRLVLSGYNPESSNFAISSFIELAPFAFGDKQLTESRLTNPTEFMQELNKKFANLSANGKTFAVTFNDALRDITDKQQYVQLIDWQSKFLIIGMDRIKSPSYLNKCTEEEFTKDFDTLLRTRDLLCKYYEKNMLKDTKNILAYRSALSDMGKIFDSLKKNKNFFKEYNSFAEFTKAGEQYIYNSNLNSLGLLQNQNSQTTTQPSQSSPNPTQPQQTGATGTKQSNPNTAQTNQTFTTATMGFRPVPKPSAPIPTMAYASRSLQDKINFLKTLKLEVKKNGDFASELNGKSGVTREDLSCAYAITQNGKNNVEDLTYREIEKTLFEIVNFPDYNSANTMLQDYMQVLNNAGYVPSYGTLARALQEMDKIENSNLDNKGARREFLRDALGKGNQMLADSMKISEYIKGQNNISSPVTHEEQSKVLLKMQDNYDKFGLNPDSNKPKNFKKFIDPQTLPKPNNITLYAKNDEEMQADIDLHRAYKNYTYQPCPYTIKDDKGEVQDIWNIQPSTLINKLAKTLTHGNEMEIQKMRIICENMKGHFNPSYADMAKLTMIINDFWKLGNDPNVDRAIESLKSIAQDKYNEAFQIAKFKAQNEGRTQATFGDMVNVFNDLEKQQQLKKQAQQTSGGYGSGM